MIPVPSGVRVWISAGHTDILVLAPIHGNQIPIWLLNGRLLSRQNPTRDDPDFRNPTTARLFRHMGSCLYLQADVRSLELNARGPEPAGTTIWYLSLPQAAFG